MKTNHLFYGKFFNTTIKILICGISVFILMGFSPKVTHAKEVDTDNKVLIQNHGDWKTETTEDGKIRIVGYSDNIDINDLVIPSSIEGMSVEVNLKEVFGEVLQNQISSFCIENSKDGLQPVRLTGDFQFLFRSQFVSSKINSIDFGDADTSNINSMAYMFSNCKSLKKLSLGKNFNTSNVTDMRSMFDGIKLKRIELGDKFNTSNVEDMSRMFSDCSELESLSLGKNFNTKSVQSMEWMFFRCLKLKKLDLGDNFNTENVKDMSQMFSTCNSLSELNLGYLFSTINVTEITGMFMNCVSLKNLDLGDNFDTSNVLLMYDTFGNCKNLEELNLGAKFDTSKVKNMQSMFEKCEKLSDFSFLDNFDTRQVQSMTSMFRDCLSIKKLNLNFDTQRVNEMSGMLNGCTNLTELKLGNNFNSKNMVYELSYYDLFKNCNSLSKLTLPGSFKIGEKSAINEAISQNNNYYWSYKKREPMSTDQLLDYHNNRPDDSMNEYELRKAHQVTFDTANIPGIPQFSKIIVWENQFFKEIPKKYKIEGYDIQWTIENEPFSEAILMTKSIVLIGKSTPIPYSITFDSSGGNKVEPLTYTIQDNIEQLPTPTKKGYKFVGWYDGSEQIISIVEGSTGDRKITAKWLLDKTSLEKVLNKEETAERSSSSYTTRSWEKYVQAIEDAKNAVIDETITLKKLNRIESTLAQAIKDLKEVEGRTSSKLTFEGLADCIIKKGEKFDPRAGVTAKDSLEGDLTNKIIITGAVDTSKVGVYLLRYSVENSFKKKLEKEVQIQVVESGSSDIKYHTIEISDLTLPRYADYKKAIEEKMIIKNAEGEVVPKKDVDYTITSEGNTDELGKMSALVAITYSNGASLKKIVEITVVSGIKVVQPEGYSFFYIENKNNSLDPYSCFLVYEIGIGGKETLLGKYDDRKKIGVEVIENPVNFSKPSNYTILYRITNSFGEKIDYSYEVMVGTLKPYPIIKTPTTTNSNNHKHIPTTINTISNTSVKKNALPKTGSMKTNCFAYILGFLLIIFVCSIKIKRTIWF